MIDKKAFYQLSYGMYVISTLEEDRPVGCVVNTFAQLTSAPFRVSVALNKENATTRALLKTGRYVATCLSTDATMDLIGVFGFRTSDEVDKFENYSPTYDEAGIPFVNQECVARFSVRVIDHIDVGSHLLFVGEVEEAEALPGEPMTYAYYHAVKGGKTPPKASSYVPDDADDAATDAATDAAASANDSERTVWRCTICGYEVEADELPDDFKCPLCGMPKEKFERVAK